MPITIAVCYRTYQALLSQDRLDLAGVYLIDTHVLRWGVGNAPAAGAGRAGAAGG